MLNQIIEVRHIASPSVRIYNLTKFGSCSVVVTEIPTIDTQVVPEYGFPVAAPFHLVAGAERLYREREQREYLVDTVLSLPHLALLCLMILRTFYNKVTLRKHHVHSCNRYKINVMLWVVGLERTPDKC